MTRFFVMGLFCVAFLITGKAAMSQQGYYASDRGDKKLCSAVSAGNYRDSFIAHPSWSASTCRKFAQSILAKSFQIGCVTRRGVVWGKIVGVDERLNHRVLPARSECNWTIRDSGRSRGNNGRNKKLCSAVSAGNYRDSFIAHRTWSVSACRKFAQSILAKSFQIGCVTQRGVVWGKIIGIDERLNHRVLPARSECNWKIRNR